MSSVSAGPRSARAAADAPDDALRRRILVAFERGAARRGPRAVVTAELARQLGISTKTLFRVFPTKAAMVGALMEAFAEGLEARQAEREAAGGEGLARLQTAVRDFVAATERYAPAFWAEIAADYPDAWARWLRALAGARARAQRWFAAILRPDADPRLAVALLEAAVRRAADPDLCRALGATREAAVDLAVALWAEGALRAPRGGRR
jgi:AcrR family transcriptional regulator